MRGVLCVTVLVMDAIWLLCFSLKEGSFEGIMGKMPFTEFVCVEYYYTTHFIRTNNTYKHKHKTE